MFNNNIEDILKAQKGNKEILEILINNNKGLIKNIVNRFIGRGYELEDLYQIGCIGFIKAIQRFDINYDVQLSTYAVPYILGEIKKYIRDDGTIKISRQTKELVNKIKMLQVERYNKTGEEIGLMELSKALNVSKEEIIFAMDSIKPIESIYQVDNNDNDKRMLLDKISNNKDEEQIIVNKILIKQLINELSKREKKIIYLRYYKDKTQSEIGKILGITQVQVSRIEKKILESMKNKMGE